MSTINFAIISNFAMEAQSPFIRILDQHHRPTQWILIGGPILSVVHQHQFAALRWAGSRFAGLSSYVTFPRHCAGDQLDYETICEVWCHCFRAPERFLHSSIPRALISASDFTDFTRISPAAFITNGDNPKRFELIYVGATAHWKKRTKNWRLAAQCIPRICRDFAYRALVLGEPDRDFQPSSDVTFIESLPWQELLTLISGARVVFVPNVLDASPRVMAEALCLNIPIVVQRQILGGWKYVNGFTGAFFDDEKNVVEAVDSAVARAKAPREWFRSHYGPFLAGQRLLDLLKQVDPSISETSHVRLCEEPGVVAVDC